MTARPAFRLPELMSHSSSSGLTLTASALPTVPLVQAHLAVPVAFDDGTDLATLDVLTACWPDLLACARFEQHGGTVAVSRRNQWLMLSLSCTADQLPLLARTFAEVVHAPYTPEVVRAAVSRAAQQASLMAAQPAVHSVRRLWERYYGHLPVFADPAADPGLVAAVTPEQVTAAHAGNIRPDHAHLVVVGDLDPADAFARIEEALAGWSGPGPGADVFQAPPAAGVPGITTHELPDWSQTHIRLAAPSPARGDLARFAAAQIAAHILGGSFASRITTVLREEHGLAYRALASLTDHLDQDLFIIEADVNGDFAGAALTHLRRILDDFATHGPTERELSDAISHVSGKYALNLGSQSGRAACALSYLTAGIPLAGITGLLTHMNGLSRADVRAAAAPYRSDRLSGVLCGAAPVQNPPEPAPSHTV